MHEYFDRKQTKWEEEVVTGLQRIEIVSTKYCSDRNCAEPTNGIENSNETKEICQKRCRHERR